MGLLFLSLNMQLAMLIFIAVGGIISVNNEVTGTSFSLADGATYPGSVPDGGDSSSKGCPKKIILDGCEIVCSNTSSNSISATHIIDNICSTNSNAKFGDGKWSAVVYMEGKAGAKEGDTCNYSCDDFNITATCKSTGSALQWTTDTDVSKFTCGKTIPTDPAIPT